MTRAFARLPNRRVTAILAESARRSRDGQDRRNEGNDDDQDTRKPIAANELRRRDAGREHDDRRTRLLGRRLHRPWTRGDGPGIDHPGCIDRPADIGALAGSRRAFDGCEAVEPRPDGPAGSTAPGRWRAAVGWRGARTVETTMNALLQLMALPAACMVVAWVRHGGAIALARALYRLVATAAATGIGRMALSPCKGARTAPTAHRSARVPAIPCAFHRTARVVRAPRGPMLARAALVGARMRRERPRWALGANPT